MRTAIHRVSVFAVFAASLLCGTVSPASAAEEFDKFAVDSAFAELSNRQAGDHADMTIGIEFTRDGNVPYAVARDIEVKLPPGMIGNPQGIPRCTVNQLGSGAGDSACPLESQVGMTEVRALKPHAGVFDEPVYNMVPPKGTDIVARFGFIAAGWPAFINVEVDPSDYGLISTVQGPPSIAGISGAITELWGVPAAPQHDVDRVTPFEAANGGAPPSGRELNAPEVPFIANPTDCSLQREVTVTARSYPEPERDSTMTVPFPQITGCGKLSFAPTFTAALTNPEAAAPTGIETELTIPQDETPDGIATSTVKSARVALPEGVTINAAAADGLEGCSADQVGYGKNEQSHCPDAAKIGSVEVDVPALESVLHGSVYQRTPEAGHLFRFWVVSDEQGVHLKLPAEIETDPVTGQVVTVFNGIDTLGGLPQVPFRSLKLDVFGGPKAPLATPSGCGSYRLDYAFAPWSGKAAVEGSTSLQVNQGCNKGGFAPKLVAGTLNSAGGKFAPFVFTLSRQDGEGNPQKIALHMPPGLLAKLPPAPARLTAGSAASPPPREWAARRCGSPSRARRPPPPTSPARTRAPPTRSSPWSRLRPGPSTSGWW
jgi:hypothetical protein